MIGVCGGFAGYLLEEGRADGTEGAVFVDPSIFGLYSQVQLVQGLNILSTTIVVSIYNYLKS